MSRAARIAVALALAGVVAVPAVAPGLVPEPAGGSGGPDGSARSGGSDDPVRPAAIPGSFACPSPGGDPTTAGPGVGDRPNDSGAGAAGPSPAPDGPRIAAVHPNPYADGDRGEFLVLAVPGGSLSGLALDDGEGRVPLPNRSVAGRVAVSPDPAAARNLTDRPVVGIGDLALSNAGERIELRRNGTVLDRIGYEDAPEGETWVPSVEPSRDGGGGSGSNSTDDPDGTWRPIRASDRPVRSLDAGSARAFVLPDAPDVAVGTLRSADRRILLAGYTLTSRRVARALRAASERGVEVRVLVDAAPVGGMARREGRILDSLVAAGVEVRVFGGERAPYEFHHAKYAVVDDRALVVTENFKPAGTGGHSSRGWGAVVRGPAVAADLADLFETDARPATSVPWERYRRDATFVEGGVADRSFPSPFSPRRVPVEEVRVLAAPDNAESGLVELLCSAEESIRVEQMTVERGPLLWATMAAARRGVRVRILASGARYVSEENGRVVRRLNRWAEREGLDLRAKLADPRSRFEKVHAKGVVVDGDRAVVGSVNWNNHSVRENRELALVLVGDRVGGYFAQVFDADWRDGAWRIPAGVGALVALAVGVSVAVARRRVRFVEG